MHMLKSVGLGGNQATVSSDGPPKLRSRYSHTYRLKFQEESDRPAKDIEFEAEDSYRALIIAHHEARRRSAELWRDGQKLCSIRRQDDGVWEIFPSK